MANRIRLFPWELESMDEYSTTIPTATTWWKMWKSDLNRNASRPFWVVRQYVPHHTRPDRLVTIRTFEVQLLEGPKPPVYHPPDWSNFARWLLDAATEAEAERASKTTA